MENFSWFWLTVAFLMFTLKRLCSALASQKFVIFSHDFICFTILALITQTLDIMAWWGTRLSESWSSKVYILWYVVSVLLMNESWLKFFNDNKKKIYRTFQGWLWTEVVNRQIMGLHWTSYYNISLMIEHFHCCNTTWSKEHIFIFLASQWKKV